MVRHLPLDIPEQENVVVVPGLLRDIVTAAVQIGEGIVVGIAAAVEDIFVAEVVYSDLNAYAGEEDVP